MADCPKCLLPLPHHFSLCPDNPARRENPFGIEEGDDSEARLAKIKAVVAESKRQHDEWVQTDEGQDFTELQEQLRGIGPHELGSWQRLSSGNVPPQLQTMGQRYPWDST